MRARTAHPGEPVSVTSPRPTTPVSSSRRRIPVVGLAFHSSSMAYAAQPSNAFRSPITRPQRPEETLVSTLEASSAQESGRRPISPWAASAAFPVERGGLPEQRGWTPRSPRDTAQVQRALALQGHHSTTTRGWATSVAIPVEREGLPEQRGGHQGFPARRPGATRSGATRSRQPHGSRDRTIHRAIRSIAGRVAGNS